eukprot:3055428-Rhodomonas_salina.5
MPHATPPSSHPELQNLNLRPLLSRNVVARVRFRRDMEASADEKGRGKMRSGRESAPPIMGFGP